MVICGVHNLIFMKPPCNSSRPKSIYAKREYFLHNGSIPKTITRAMRMLKKFLVLCFFFKTPAFRFFCVFIRSCSSFGASRPEWSKAINIHSPPIKAKKHTKGNSENSPLPLPYWELVQKNLLCGIPLYFTVLSFSCLSTSLL